MQNLITVTTPVNTTVVQNDTLATISVTARDKVHVASSVTLASAYKRLEQLVSERELWEQGALRTSNEQLYALLSKCYALYFEMCGKSANAKAMRAELESYIKQMSYRFLDSTHTLTKIVKCVFGVDRKRVSTYSLVLREAFAQNLKVEQIAAFISSKGGVQEISRSKGKNSTTPKQRAELGKQVVNSNELAVVSSSKIAQAIDVSKVGNVLVAIVEQLADGSLIIRQLVHSQTVLNAALASAYSASKVENKQEVANIVAANDAKALDMLIAEAA